MSVHNPKPLPSAKYLKECFDYDEKTGVCLWKKRPLHHFNCDFDRIAWNGHFAGKVAGWLDDGYIKVKVNSVSYKMHRLVFKMHYNYDPKIIDHLNRVRSDNRIENLVNSNLQRNRVNSGPHKNNTTGVKGVVFKNKASRYECYVKRHGVKKYLGSSKNIFDAACIRLSKTSQIIEQQLQNKDAA